MQEKIVNTEDILDYFKCSKKIADLESTLYESGRELSTEESKIDHVVTEQNKIRFDGAGNDRFRSQLETVINILAANYKKFGFDYNLYFDLVYNLLLLEYDRVEELNKQDEIAQMLEDINISDHLKGRVKALLDHEEEMANMKTES